MANPFNPQKPQDSALNAVMLGAMGTGKPSGPAVILATAIKEYANGEDIVNHTDQALARETLNGRVRDTGTKFRLENTLAGGSRAEIPSKNAIVGEFSGASAFSMKGRIVTAGAAISVISMTMGTTSEPTPAASSVFARIFAVGAGNPLVELFYRNTGGGSVLLATTSSYPIAETALIRIERAGGLFLFTVTAPTLGTVLADISVSLVQNGASDMFVDVRREAAVNEPDENEVNEITGYPVS